MLYDVVNLVTGICIVLLAWGTLAVTIVSLGCALKGILANSQDESFPQFWVGLCLLLAYVQIWNFFLPVSPWTLISSCVLGLCASRGKILWKMWQFKMLSVIQSPWESCGIALFALWVANRCLGPNLYFDGAFYHIAQIEWATQYPVIPGLANLDLLMANNTSCLLLAAMVDVGPLHLHSMMIVNGLLLVVTMMQVLRTVSMVSRNSATTTYGLLVLPTIIIEFAGTTYLAATDFASGLMVLQSLPLIGQLVRPVESVQKQIATDMTKYSVIVMILTASICLKQTTIFVSTLILFHITVIMTVRYRSVPTALFIGLIRTIGLSLVIIAPWFIRSVILSGYLIFPSSSVGIDVEWRVPAEIIERYQRELIYQTNHVLVQIPHGASSIEWHKQFIVKVLTKGRAMFVVPLVISVLCVAMMLYGWLTRRWELQVRYVPIVLNLTIGLVIWLELAPQLRYGYFIVWGMAMVLFSILVDGMKTGNLRRLLSVSIFALSLLAGISIQISRFISTYNHVTDSFGNLLDRPLNRPGPNYGFHPDKAVQHNGEYRVTRHGVKVLVYERGKYSWDAPLPHTHFFNNNLKQVNPAGMRSGFIIVPEPGDVYKGWGDHPSLEPLPK